jgi:CHAT domain-containing protein
MFRDLLMAVHDKKNEIPMVLFLSQEPYIPWELAFVDPVFDPGAPPFLAGQTNMGRWVLGHGKALLPPVQVSIRNMAVVWGVYNRKPGWMRLLAAEQEAQDLRTEYGASSIDAEVAPVLSCLNGTPVADILHFAVHGIYDPQSCQQGLVLVDGNYIDPIQIKGSVLKNAPFVFLNACQVGSGDMLLGDYAGMAEAFLSAGASAVLAPLWSVKDTLAKDIAMAFYKKTFAGQPVAEALRHARRGYNRTGESSATCLAYQFFGHPGLKLQRETSSIEELL